MIECNRDCFNCKFDDCVVDTVSNIEKVESNIRDMLYVGGFGTVRGGRRAKGSLQCVNNQKSRYSS